MPLMVLCVFVLALLAGCDRAPKQLSTEPVAEIEFELIDESGMPVTQQDFADRLQVVFFGFTSCPDICPITLHNVATALHSMEDAAQDVIVLFISIDPKRDTPERLVQYTAAFHDSVIGLTGSWQQLTAVTSLFRTTFGFSVNESDGAERTLSESEYVAMAPEASYTPFHSSLVYVVDTEGNLLDTIGYGSGPERIEAVLRTHLR